MCILYCKYVLYIYVLYTRIFCNILQYSVRQWDVVADPPDLIGGCALGGQNQYQTFYFTAHLVCWACRYIKIKL